MNLTNYLLTNNIQLRSNVYSNAKGTQNNQQLAIDARERDRKRANACVKEVVHMKWRRIR